MNETVAPSVEIVRFHGALGFYKLPRTWKRHLEIRLTHTGEARPFHRQSFPADADQVLIQGLDTNQEVDVQIQAANILRRLKRRPQKTRVLPSPRPLRTIISGSGRCGTTTLARYLDGMRFADGEKVEARHETLNEYLLPRLLARDQEALLGMVNGMTHNVESAPYFALLPEMMNARQVVLLVRDGRRVCQSGLNRGWYGSDSLWNRIKPDFEGTPFEKICRFWRFCNEQVEQHSTHFVRLEDLSTSPEARQQLLDDLGLVASGQLFPHSNKGLSSSGFGSWTDEMKEIFTAINGEMMDRYYPGWRETW